MKYMKYEDFVTMIFGFVKSSPKEWRRGQAVFNVIDEKFGVARDVQFGDGVDCFYDDSKIEEFIKCSWRRLQDDDN